MNAVVPSTSRVTVLPKVFVTANVRAPAAFARRIAPSVSAVSPLWVTATTSVRSGSARAERVFAGCLDSRPDAGEFLEELRRVPAGVVGGPAGDDLDLFNVSEKPRRERDVEVDIAALDIEPSGKRLSECPGCSWISLRM